MNQGTDSPMPTMGFGTWNGNEAEVGLAIAASGLPRGDIFLTTKVAPENFGPGEVRPHVEASLERLGVDDVDLLLKEGYAIIPSSGDRGRIAENFAAQDLELDADEMAELRGLDRGMRLVDGPWCPKWDT